MYGPGQGHHLQLSMGVCELSRHYWEISSYQGELFLCAAAPGNRNSRDYHQPVVIKQQIKRIAFSVSANKMNPIIETQWTNSKSLVMSVVLSYLKWGEFWSPLSTQQRGAMWEYLGCHNELELHVTALGAWRVLWTGEADWKYNCFNLLTRNILTLTEFLRKIKQLANFLVKLVELSSYWAQNPILRLREMNGRVVFFLFVAREHFSSFYENFKILQKLREVDCYSFVCIDEGFAGWCVTLVSPYKVIPERICFTQFSMNKWLNIDCGHRVTWSVFSA